MTENQTLEPRDHAEAVALFRAQVVGELAARELTHGELAAALRQLASRRFRPPEGRASRCYSVPTLERWYHRYRKHGLGGVTPQRRSDRGYAQGLSDEERQLLLDVRRDHRSLSARHIVRALVQRGQLRANVVSLNSLRRLYRAHGLERLGKRHQGPGKSRLSWEAAYPGKVWHADVCHGPRLEVDGRKIPLRVHGILDDNSRYLVGLQACSTEMEVDMLQLLTAALRRWGRPEVLYLDNGATYRGETLALACNRLGIKLVHAQPYDPQARGKMERFWRTLRQGCLDHLPTGATLHDVNLRLMAFLDGAYHVEPHSGLVAETPEQRWLTRSALAELSEEQLREALTVQVHRRLSKTGILTVAGVEWELDKGFLAGRKVTVFRSVLDAGAAPWVEWDGKRLQLHRVDRRSNAERHRTPPKLGKGPIDRIPFDPVEPLVDALVGRDPRRQEAS